MKKIVLSGHDVSDGHKEALLIVQQRNATPGECQAERAVHKINQEAFRTFLEMPMPLRFSLGGGFNPKKLNILETLVLDAPARKCPLF